MLQKQKQGPTDTDLCNNWDALLKEFNNLWVKSPKDFKKFEALKQKAKTTPLTPRQTEGITDRCNNVINGIYGKSKAGIEFKVS